MKKSVINLTQSSKEKRSIQGKKTDRSVKYTL